MKRQTRLRLLQQTSGAVVAVIVGDECDVVAVDVAVVVGGYDARPLQQQRTGLRDCAVAVEGVVAADGDAVVADDVVVDVGDVVTTSQPTWTKKNRRHRHRAVVNDDACGVHGRDRCRGDYYCCGYFGGHAYGGDEVTAVACRVAAAVGVADVGDACLH